MGKQIVYWFGYTQRLEWARKKLVSAQITLTTDLRNLISYCRQSQEIVTLIVDMSEMNQDKVLQFQKLLSSFENIRMIFFFDQSDVPQLEKVLNRRFIYFIHRYDDFALRGCLLDLLDSPTMFLRRYKRQQLMGYVQIRKMNESKWRQLEIIDESEQGLGIKFKGPLLTLKLRDQVLIRYRNTQGRKKTYLAEIRWLDRDFFVLRAGLKFTSQELISTA